MADVLNKKALAEALVEKFGLTKRASGEIVEEVFEEIFATLKNGGVVDIAGFGKFVIKERGERTGTNPKTKEKIVIPPSKSAGFKAAKALKEALK